VRSAKIGQADAGSQEQISGALIYAQTIHWKGSLTHRKPGFEKAEETCGNKLFFV